MKQIATRLGDVDVRAMLSYLRRTHSYFLQERFPTLRVQLRAAIEGLQQNAVGFLVLKYFNRYAEEVASHMHAEEHTLFAYVEEMLDKEGPVPRQKHASLIRHHRDIENKFMDLRTMAQKYLPEAWDNDLLREALYALHTTEEDLLMHCLIEDKVFMPAVARLEAQKERGKSVRLALRQTDTVEVSLTAREQAVAECVARGMSNKETAEKLYISLHTVTTHRRNIARKLNIHSSAGLTLYCIAKGLLCIDEVNLAGGAI